MPRLRQGCCFLDWLLARRVREERALTTMAPAGILDQADGEAVRTTQHFVKCWQNVGKRKQAQPHSKRKCWSDQFYLVRPEGFEPPAY
jgi:hypothetical protein